MANIDKNALLLQVMAHDLLAPLTAIKWQMEIMEKDGCDHNRFIERARGVADSTQLGISLTKHAHVAGRVLVGSYEAEYDDRSLTRVVEQSVADLSHQYERNGVGLSVDIVTNEHTQSVDVNLVSLFVWSVAKFVLTVVSAGSSVHFYGETDGQGVLTLVVTATNVPDLARSLEAFTAIEAQNTYDQMFVFSDLVHTIAPLVDSSVTARAEGVDLRIEALFSVHRPDTA